MNACTEQELRKLLLERGWIESRTAAFTPLTGGVSSEIFLVEDGGRRFVVKRALEKLKVAADWFADTARNHSEQAYIRYVGSFRPDAMPAILGSDAKAGLFAMEFLDGFSNWKQALLDGRCDTALARKAGKLLGEIHARSWGAPEVLAQFDSIPNFDQLRIDPYLRATAAEHPTLQSLVLAEAERLTESRECLIHGDYSPKNILFNEDRLVPLDCEVACFADAAFDLSFFLNHLFLKSLYHAPNSIGFPPMVDAARAGYREGNAEHADAVEGRTAHLLPMLLLARVDGKSPVEYLKISQQEFIRQFVHDVLAKGNENLSTLQKHWFESILSM